MITFPCVCGLYRFSVPESEAGASYQCPTCKRLNDVPLLSDLGALDDDGTLKIADDTIQRNDPKRLAEAARIYGKSRVDEEGNEIDLRQTFDDLRRAGAKEIPLVDEEGQLVNTKPRYDPITGELIRPLELKPEEPQAVLPVAGSTAMDAAADEVATGIRGGRASVRMKGRLGLGTRPADVGNTLSYAARATRGAKNMDTPSLASLPMRLFEPVNLMVMFFVAVMFFGSSLITVPFAGGIFIAGPVMFLMYGLIMAHYACCIEELGPGEQVELPRPLRDFEFGADMWYPFTRMFFALMVCYGGILPVLLFARGGVMFVALPMVLAFGAMLFPVVLLVNCASGSYLNLRPDRVLGTISVLGLGTYVWLIVVGALAVLFGTGSLFGLSLTMLIALTTRSKATLWSTGLMGTGSLLVGIYLAHYFTWMLGVLYRRHVQEFPWFFEQHERDRVNAKRMRSLALLEAGRQRKYGGA